MNHVTDDARDADPAWQDAELGRGGSEPCE